MQFTNILAIIYFIDEISICCVFLICQQGAQRITFNDLVAFATSGVYLSLAHALGVYNIPDDSTVQPGDPNFNQRASTVCRRITEQMAPGTRVAWFPVILSFLVSLLCNLFQIVQLVFKICL